MTDIDISVGSTNGIREERLHIRGQGTAAKSLGPQTKQKPLGSQVDRQCGDDPVWCVGPGKMLFQKRHAVSLFQSDIRAFTPQ
jgi:hypothetical protein